MTKPKYEYKRCLHVDEDSEEWLNSYGNDGWLLIQIISAGGGLSDFVLVREKED